jgi:transcription initiation factor TFIIE subunit beta
MSGLARDAAAFKSALSRQDYSSWHSNPSPASSQPTASSSSGGAGAAGAAAGIAEPKKKRPKNSMAHHPRCILLHILSSSPDVVYSQPADTGTGVNLNTQLVYAVNYLKVCYNDLLYMQVIIIKHSFVVSRQSDALAGPRHRYFNTTRYRYISSREIQSTRPCRTQP